MTMKLRFRQKALSLWAVKECTMQISLLQTVAFSLYVLALADLYWWIHFGYNGKENAMFLSISLFTLIQFSSHQFGVFHHFVDSGEKWLQDTSPYRRRGQPSLSSFSFFPSKLATLRGKCKSVGIEVFHYETTSYLPNVWWWVKKAQMTYFFVPNVVETLIQTP